jgi:asparagine synthase (glutamine-hydrolysing)
MADVYDEPFADASQIPTFLLAKMAKNYVTVCLSGDGADELFGGYKRYNWAASVWNRFSFLPLPIRKTLASILRALPPDSWNEALKNFILCLPERYRYKNPGHGMHKLGELFLASSEQDLYSSLVRNWKNPEEALLHSEEYIDNFEAMYKFPCKLGISEKMMYLDSQSYLPDGVLVKVDRAAMAVSLETRAPFLDHRVVETSWRLPADMKIRNGDGKWPLRQLLYKRVPKSLIERPKTGFGVPLGAWLRGPLRDWGESLLDESRLKQGGFFDHAVIRKKWDEHQKGMKSFENEIWNVLMFESWREKQKLK